MIEPKQLRWIDQINPQVHEVWSGRWKPGTIEPQRRLIDHELVLFTEGDCEVELADARLSCPGGSYLIIPPGAPHVTRAGPKAVTRYCVHFDWIASRPPPQTMLWSFSPNVFNRALARSAPAGVPSVILRGNYTPKNVIDVLMKSLFSRWKAPGGLQRHLCKPLLLEILLRLFSDLAPEAASAHPIGIAERAREKLDDLPLGKSLDSITAELEKIGYSYAHVCRAFTKRYGIAPLRYVTQSRMDRARRMLEDEHMKVIAVARELGYDDVGYFIRVFRRYVGRTPGAYGKDETQRTGQ